MAERRSLGEALSLTPEKVQFIKSDKNGAFGEHDQATENTGRVEANQAIEPSEPAQKPPKQPEERVLPSEQTRSRIPATAPTYAPSLVSITTRLQQDTAAALRRAYLEQKLNRQHPDTQQEIIEEALQHWLYEHGFLT